MGDEREEQLLQRISLLEKQVNNLVNCCIYAYICLVNVKAEARDNSGEYANFDKQLRTLSDVLDDSISLRRSKGEL